MERTLLLTLSIALASLTNAQLAPQQDAPLKDHLLEVNRFWASMDPAPRGGERTVHFANEAERIAMHLHMVCERLSAVERPLDATTAQKRASALAALNSYADRGVFPQNHVLPVRNPVFIDPVGTACAVGQLMIESGHRDLALRISNEMNLAYVHDMQRQDVIDWAVEHGFTENELAWIQPGYPPNYDWHGLGDGTNGPVTELLRLTNGDLIVAGSFTLAGDVSCTRVARWDGSIYHDMGVLPEGEVRASVEFNGSIHLGGLFGSGVYDLMRWDGDTWVPSTVFASKTAEITALHVHNGVLHAAGATTGFAGTAYSVRKQVGNDWIEVGQQLNGPIHALETFNNALVCGGAFTDNFLSLDTTILHTATLSGNTWQELANGLNGTVYDMLVDQGQLYAGGDLVGEVVVYFGMARMAAGASTWEQLMPNLPDYIYSPLDGLVHIHAMQARSGSIYFGGDMGISSGLSFGFGLGVLTGPDEVGVMANFNGGVYDIDLVLDTALVCGGLFDMNSGLSAPYIVSEDLTTGIAPVPTLPNDLNVWPNPAIDHLNMGLAPAALKGAVVHVLDAQGRICDVHAVNLSTRLDVADLAPGTYTLRIIDKGRIRTASFVKR